VTAEVGAPTQPRVSDLLNGKISKFSLDALVNMLAPVGLSFDVRPIGSPPPRAGAKKTKASARNRSTTSSDRKALSAY
jgi:hypothetical protein